MTPQDALSVFGSQIHAKYYNGTDYTDFVFTYDSVQTVSSVYSSVSYPDSVYSGAQYLEYRVSVSDLPSYNTDINYITVDISPTYSIFDTEFIYSFVALTDYGSVSTAYQSPSCDWVWNGRNVHIENSAIDPTVSGGLACFGSSSTGNHEWFTFVPVDLTSTSNTSGYCTRATFSGNDISNRNTLCFAIGIPYISYGATGSQGTFTTSPSSDGGDTNITVNVDMSETNEKIEETNGILSTIHSWLSSFFSTLGSTVLSWFMPSQNFLSNWVSQIMNTIEEHFSPWPILNERITTMIQNIMNTMGQGGVESVEFPAIDVPLDVPGQDPNASFTISSQSVPLFPNGTSPLRDLLKDGLDMVCTIWVFNMVLNRIKAKILGEQVVEIEGAEES